VYYLDTNICIYALKGTYPNIQAKIASTKPNKIKLASIVRAELLLGAKKSINKKSLKIIESFMRPFSTVDFCHDSATVYAETRAELESEGKIIGPNDLILASTVIANNGILVTHNTSEFSRVKGLRIEDWC
jgi:tRNA(fMet)-specific endonuclease VapC